MVPTAVADAPTAPVVERGLEPCRYFTLIARPIPENSILELVGGFSARPPGLRLAGVGAFDDNDPYARDVQAAASEDVSFLGGIYELEVVPALRLHCVGRCSSTASTGWASRIRSCAPA